MNEHRLEVADIFRQHGEEFLKQWGRTVSPQQRKALRDIAICRTATLGATSSSVISADTASSRITRAVTGIAPSVSLQRVTVGWQSAQRSQTPPAERVA